MSNYDNWKTTTPEDTEHEERDRIDQAQARIERRIDGLEDRRAQINHRGIDRSHNFDYDPFNP